MFRSTANLPTTHYSRMTSENNSDDSFYSYYADDYRFSDESLEIAGAEYQGYRDSQEDCMDFALLAGFESLTAAQQNAVIINTINDVQRSLEEATISSPGTGSCLIATILLPIPNQNQYELVTVSLGDSVAYMVTVDKALMQAEAKDDNNVCTNAVLINEFHKPGQPKEAKRLAENFPNTVFRNRLNGALAVSGAIGDQGFHKFGLTHVPNIYRSGPFATTDASKDVYVITACDGLMEEPAAINRVMSAAFANKDTSLLTISQTLAFKSLSMNDNISVFLARANNRRAPLTTPLVTAVYDGHGGGSVSKLLQRSFLPRLIANMRLELKRASALAPTIRDYVTEIHQAFLSVDNATAFYTHLKMAEDIKARLSADDKKKSWNPGLFSSTQGNQSFNEKELGLLDANRCEAEELYDAEPPQDMFTRYRNTIIALCEKMLQPPAATDAPSIESDNTLRNSRQ